MTTLEQELASLRKKEPAWRRCQDLARLGWLHRRPEIVLEGWTTGEQLDDPYASVFFGIWPLRAWVERFPEVRAAVRVQQLTQRCQRVGERSRRVELLFSIWEAAQPLGSDPLGALERLLISEAKQTLVEAPGTNQRSLRPLGRWRAGDKLARMVGHWRTHRFLEAQELAEQIPNSYYRRRAYKALANEPKGACGWLRTRWFLE